MTPELNKTERLPDDAGPDVTQRISAGAAEQPDGAEPAEHKTAFSSLRESYMRPGMGAREASRKSRVGPQRA